MLFVPLPLFASLLLVLALVRFCLSREMRVRAHQLFALLVALYALQTLLASLRWGYEVERAAKGMILMAPLLPVIAYLAYRALSGPIAVWPLALVVLNWLVYAIAPEFSDAAILMTYIGFGGLLLRLGSKGIAQVALSAINDAADIRIAIYVTGGALIASGLTDIYIIYDFVRNDGQTAPVIITFVQTAFVLAIGISGVVGRSTATASEETQEPAPAPQATLADSEIVEQLERLFEAEHLHRNEDLSLRRLARKIGVPDRQVSNAINRVRGVSVSQFVNGFRIQEACDLLRDTDRTVLDISLASGFASKSNFNREFARMTGKSPTQWRQGQS
ncbi:helix-turn-helix transcriptional regulator [Marivivens donghaensis]|uniref:Helix-turn-helix transcriptional regulator n=1 Tax=Marivivens donghaensis TaxID=1699413 RepID=A0ABX0W204_9RHOB|nr:AraC family transcriptional regulator [Marivivens donghaensis]NIY73690.1 helix-turn-helix transcriptional regulator [Marivivens donghaensis]